MTINCDLHRSWRIVHSEASLGWGGQEHRILAELTGFKKRGSEVRLLAPQDAVLFARAQAAGIPCEPFSDAKWRFPFEVLRVARWLRRLRPDVLNTHSSRDGWLVGLAGRLARVPLILRTRHVDVEYPNRWISQHAFTTLADAVLTTSDRITDHLCRTFQLSEDRVLTVPTGIDVDHFKPEGDHADLGPAPVVGMVSVLRSWKGHRLFLEAIRLLVRDGFPYRFIIVGEGPMHDPILRWREELGLEGKVDLVGHREDVPAVLRGMSLLVIPSTAHEGVPQVGLQALACGTPLIGSDVGGIPQIIRSRETGRLFPSGDAAALAAAIRETFAQADETQRMSMAGRRLVMAKHSLAGMLDTLEDLYRARLRTKAVQGR